MSEKGLVVADKLKEVLASQNATPEIVSQLATAFGAPFTEAGEILADYQYDEKGELIITDKTIVVTDETDKKAMADAKAKRLALKKVRTTVENKRKEMKEDINKSGQAIDAVARFIKTTIEPAEAYLELQEKYGEVKAAERAATLKAERTEKLMQYTNNISAYNLDTMQDETFSMLLNDLKASYEARIAKEEAEKKAEQEAIEAEKKRQEEIEADNIRLRKEAEAREITVAKINARINELARLGLVWSEREAIYALDDLEITHDVVHNVEDQDTYASEFDRVTKVINERAELQKKQQEEKDAAIAAERDAERKIAEDERKKREEIEEAERKRIAQIEADKAAAEDAERKALLAPDKDKLSTFSKALEIIRTEKLPAVKTKSAQDIVNFIDDSLTKLQTEIAKRSKEI